LNALTIRARSAARRIGLLGLIQRMRPRRSYEEEFGRAMLASIRHGDVVWDVGANVGFYTRRFLERVGHNGTVVAFEPEPACFQILSHECADAIVVNSALGDRAQSGFIEFHVEPKNGTHRLVNQPNDHSKPVQIIAGDDYQGAGPNVIKIDVEGFEEEVLMGMPRILGDPGLRAIFLEVHFALLEQRGNVNAPLRIERMLRERHFKTRWFHDRSHLEAIRHTTA
jgi:FkbM family methyltransferase